MLLISEPLATPGTPWLLFSASGNSTESASICSLACSFFLGESSFSQGRFHRTALKWHSKKLNMLLPTKWSRSTPAGSRGSSLLARNSASTSCMKWAQGYLICSFLSFHVYDPVLCRVSVREYRVYSKVFTNAEKCAPTFLWFKCTRRLWVILQLQTRTLNTTSTCIVLDSVHREIVSMICAPKNHYFWCWWTGVLSTWRRLRLVVHVGDRQCSVR